MRVGRYAVPMREDFMRFHRVSHRRRLMARRAIAARTHDTELATTDRQRSHARHCSTTFSRYDVASRGRRRTAMKHLVCECSRDDAPGAGSASRTHRKFPVLVGLEFLALHPYEQTRAPRAWLSRQASFCSDERPPGGFLNMARTEFLKQGDSLRNIRRAQRPFWLASIWRHFGDDSQNRPLCP
jgi:hypothetical protein